MARRASTVIALIAALLGMFFMTSSAHALSAVRTSSFEYYADSGLLKKEIIEPGNSQLCLVTEYEYDTFGNKTKVTTRNCDGSAGEAAAPTAGSLGVIASRSTASEYDARGQFAVKTTNALNHSETRTFDERFGGVKSLTGPNGLTTSWTYDSFGRKKTEVRADGSNTLWVYGLCTGCNTSADMAYVSTYIATKLSNESRYSYAYYDNLNRHVLTRRHHFDNRSLIYERSTWYDSYGRVAKVYQPYVYGQLVNTLFTSYTYDELGRVKSETAPDGGITTKAYDGLTTAVTNALNQKTTTVKNTQGQTVRVTDAMSKSINYVYDPFGNLTQTIDAQNNATRLYYDPRGRKTRMDDPDMGTWTYAYNALGELVWQKDAKSQIVTMTYDLLGRMTKRSEPDLISTWEYDGPKDANGNLIPDGNGKGVGKLYKATGGNGYSRTHSYDTLGRLSSTSTVIDNPAQPYVTSTTYDSNGRVDIQTYPASPGHPNGFAVKNIYNTNGYLIKVVNAADTTKMYWQADAMDAMGHLTQQTYGNNMVTQQTYYADSGRLKEQFAGAGNAVQNMSYQYDSLGNLSTREDKNQFLTETYTYDDLNRLKTANSISGIVNVTNNFAYDAIGNITCKSDISTCTDTASNYVYNATIYLGSTYSCYRRSLFGGVVCGWYPNYRRLPHAVSQIAGTINGVVNPGFIYDLNGNMISGAGRTIAWTSFNMPSQITNGSKTTSFLYNPEHERTIENQVDGSKVVALSPRYDTGLHFEKKFITNPATKQFTGAVEYEHYLYAGGQMFGKYVTVTATDGVTLASAKTTYYSKDHLGSIVAITDEAGNIATDGSGQLARYSYDVWGKRRYPNGAADPNGLLNNPDMYHGYTGHEMLDEVGLIHMNGRLYDPLTGRFISPDIYIQAPGNLQSYNRYAYVMNNPLAMTDPGGHFWGWVFAAIFTARATNVIDVQTTKQLVGIAVGAMLGPMGPWGGWAGGGIAQAGIAGFASGVITSGTLQGGLQGAFSASLFNAAGMVGEADSFGRYAAHAAAGCISAAAGGGNCAQGSLSAVVGKWATNATEGWKAEYRFVAATITGGTVSVLGGGKFASGAQTAAFGYLFNFLQSEYNKKTGMLTMKDTDTGKVTQVRVFSGDGKSSPIENGEYDMLQYADSRTKVRLEALDSYYGDDMQQASGRGEFRFHHYGLGFNFGCISTINNAEWTRAAEAIFSTRTLTATVHSKSFGGGTEKLKAFGRLRVFSGE